ncbi:arylsulfotransferase family protein [Asanoa sp. NPDC049573]|uniref:arylsulfotransferase family protein n=1 Tax=Asanoa sp. NPDC049573 TaxID=3155396 RepID=UPI0034344983
MTDNARPPVTRRRLLAGGGGLVAAAAVGGGGFAWGRSGRTATADPSAPTAAPHAFHTRPDLAIPVVDVRTTGPTAGGLVFLTPAAGGGGRGPLLVDGAGQPVWFRQVTGPGVIAVDARVQQLGGEPVLTWWEGTIDPKYGIGSGEFVIVDRAYKEIRRLRSPGPTPADQHDLLITARGSAIFFCYEPVGADLRSVGGPADAALVDCVLYEVDVATGKILFRWRGRDHIGVDESYAPAPSGATARVPYDYLHANSLTVDTDGTLVMSARHTWTIYKIDRGSGAIRWRLGGKRSDFTMGPDAAFAWQHDARRRSDGTLSLFDNEAGVTTRSSASRGLILAVDETARTATLVRALAHPDALLAPSQGSVQELPGGGSLVGWGQQPRFTEYAADGTLVASGALPADNGSYRAYKFDWSGTPDDRPMVAAVRGTGEAVTVYASWNGATAVRRWRVRAGTQPDKLAVAATSGRDGFETALSLTGPAVFVAVDALDANGRTIGSSPVTAVPPAAAAG